VVEPSPWQVWVGRTTPVAHWGGSATPMAIPQIFFYFFFFLFFMDFGPIFIPYFTLGFLFNKHTQYLYITKLIIGNAFSFRPKRRYASSFCSLPHIFAKYFPNIYWKRKIKIKIKKIKERNKEEVGSTRHTGNVVGHPLGVTFWHIILLVTLSVARSPSPIQNKQLKKRQYYSSFTPLSIHRHP